MKSTLDIKSALDYKRLVASKMVPVQGERIGELIPESSQYYFSEKLDGFLCLAVNNGSTIQFYDQNGTELDLKHLEKEFPVKAEGIWAGELYVSEGRSYSFLVAAALASDSTKLSLAIFDSIGSDNNDLNQRIKLVNSKFSSTGKVHAIKYDVADSRSVLIAQFNKIIDSAGEGMVIHIPTTGISYKVKPLRSVDCVVLGYALRENKPQIRELLLGLTTSGGFWVVGKVSTGFSENAREEWFKRLDKIKTDSKCLEIAGNGLAFYWVKPEIVVEISCQELVFENSTGTIRKSFVSFGKKGYEMVSQVPSFSFLHPVFVQERLDKKVSEDDCGPSQVGWASNSLITEKITEIKESSATVIERAVYVKDAKGSKAIRKFTVWKSDSLRNDCSPFYIYFTDFSAGRKDPLQTELYVATSEEFAKSKMQELIDENIKKGWEKQG